MSIVDVYFKEFDEVDLYSSNSLDFCDEQIEQIKKILVFKGDGITMFVNDRVVAIGYFLDTVPNEVGYFGMYASNEARKYPKSLVKNARKFIEDKIGKGYVRLEIIIDAFGDKDIIARNRRFLFALSDQFESEGFMRNASGFGKHGQLYAITKNNEIIKNRWAEA